MNEFQLKTITFIKNIQIQILLETMKMCLVERWSNTTMSLEFSLLRVLETSM